MSAAALAGAVAGTELGVGAAGGAACCCDALGAEGNDFAAEGAEGSSCCCDCAGEVEDGSACANAAAAVIKIAANSLILMCERIIAVSCAFSTLYSCTPKSNPD